MNSTQVARPPLMTTSAGMVTSRSSGSIFGSKRHTYTDGSNIATRDYHIVNNNFITNPPPPTLPSLSRIAGVFL